MTAAERMTVQIYQIYYPPEQASIIPNDTQREGKAFASAVGTNNNLAKEPQKLLLHDLYKLLENIFLFGKDGLVIDLHGATHSLLRFGQAKVCRNLNVGSYR